MAVKFLFCFKLQKADDQKKSLKCCMGVLCKWVKLLTDLQILYCELHRIWRLSSAPGYTGGAIALPQTHQPLLGERRKGKERKGLGIGKEGKARL